MPHQQPQAVDEEIRIGISTCLLGEEVRFDGGHKRSRFVTDQLGPFVSFVSVCPEVDIGLGIPRESIRLQRQGEETHLVAPKSGADHTRAMARYAQRKVRELASMDLCGYILKKDSPSCGMERVRVYEQTGGARRTGVGAFARVLKEALPHLPLEEEGRLSDARLRENFLERVFAYRRLRTLFASRWRSGDLVRFHTAEKLLLLAHDPVSYRELGRIVANPRARSRKELVAEYSALFMHALRRMATIRKHTNVLQHVQGYFKKCATAEDRRELEAVIEDFRRELIPLVVPITLVRHLVRHYDVEYLRGQTYLEPHPKELMLRNHV
ncbi:MAG: DUF523 and DUF1722 domain-containing protein [Candidatus Latescibacterota bacterium]|nr:MAG: DUF523 and DUF1722 domain-containing protein [Candidatus Latescibacterota bacterium]